ncbi:unnamed protein product [Polarella glacialis]|uniref:Peptide-methionine (R)-S-oxide reductase n=1 Tax=Polarella glacialis TaxID=89957 RepID=A0A813IYR6_POLGL|nr:unnamed protein product [Polarella glacialis]|mmetsp:Transcript_46682/g.75749  ORF Transcript_46682/g.75749 Transcript_46682/m.75749 type:complete len:206 (+) Transcript_46682:97-714(+)
MFWSRAAALVLFGLSPSSVVLVSASYSQGSSALQAHDVQHAVAKLEARLSAWKKPEPSQLEASLNPLQFQVTQKEGTEPAFTNAYWNNHAPGIYVDVVSGEPLFSSKDKFDSGTGWPSFTKPIPGVLLSELTDKHLGVERTEARSRIANSHLGHVFDDGPRASGGLRYCMNSASLRFVPEAEMDDGGYGELRKVLVRIVGRDDEL